MGMIDIIILVIVAFSALIGVFRGLVKEALSLASWFAAILAGTLFSAQLADLMENLINNPSLRRIAAFALLFIVVIFAGTLISNMVSKLTEAAGLKGADRTLGGLFGVLRGIIIVLVIILVGTLCSGNDRLSAGLFRNWAVCGRNYGIIYRVAGGITETGQSLCVDSSV